MEASVLIELRRDFLSGADGIASVIVWFPAAGCDCSPLLTLVSVLLPAALVADCGDVDGRRAWCVNAALSFREEIERFKSRAGVGTLKESVAELRGLGFSLPMPSDGEDEAEDTSATAELVDDAREPSESGLASPAALEPVSPLCDLSNPPCAAGDRDRHCRIKARVS